MPTSADPRAHPVPTHPVAPAGRDDGLHALVWVVWVLAGAAALQVAPSPPVVIVAVAVAGLVVVAHGQPGPLRRALPVLVGVAAVFVALRVVLTGLTTQSSEAVLIDLPSAELPGLLGGFTVGGAVSSQAVLTAITEGVAIIGIIGVFAAFNSVVRHVDLIRIVPRAFHEVGLIVTVALAFVPALVTSIGAVRDAEAARTGGAGRRRGRVRRTVVPVLEGALDRALVLSETLDSRGFGHGGTTRVERRAAVLAVLAVITGVAAFGALIGRAGGVAAGLGGSAALLLAVAVVTASRGARRPRYRPRRLHPRDLAVAGCALAVPLALVALRAAGSPGLVWLPSVDPLPVVDPLALATLAGLAAPVAVRRAVPTRAAAST